MSTTTSAAPIVRDRARQLRAWATTAALTLGPVTYLVIETAGTTHP